MWISFCVLVVLVLLVPQSTPVGMTWDHPLCDKIPMVVFENSMHYWNLYGNSCYVYIYHRLEYRYAQRYCHRLNASVVEINDEKENADVSRYVQIMTDEHNDTWIGINRIFQNEWIYGTSRTPLTFTKWDDYEPNVSGNCAVFRKSDKWFAQVCAQTKTFVCEQPYVE
ncbi:C-type lectin domain family 1 member B-like [Pomacea canaliculata]|uniref:C-type lectin domain family 1 member B-like n=1 Tax=Pomacea canaliculata TaxID=400727 RepID=UPI000D73FEFF|nr:C-type lectin domain family 1 member B-like [Pomacea canaliculata]XP_025101228.1 C-type lectin domain family 1 member B-like [Pomacea canaliculata]